MRRKRKEQLKESRSIKHRKRYKANDAAPVHRPVIQGGKK